MNHLLAQIGNIQPPETIPTVEPGKESDFVAGFISAGLQLLLIVSFVTALIFIIIAGLRFITSGSDEKAVSSAWSQIYWGLIGMVVVLAAFAIMKLVETFFGVTIISGTFQLPNRLTP